MFPVLFEGFRGFMKKFSFICAAFLATGCVAKQVDFSTPPSSNFPRKVGFLSGVTAKPLPAGTFRVIGGKADEVIPRVDLVMTSGPAEGQKFYCNIVYIDKDFAVAPECDHGKTSSVDVSCVDRNMCFPGRSFQTCEE